MPTIDTSSDLIEVTFTPQELNKAMQLCDSNLSLAYLQKLRVAIFRQIVSLRFTPDEQEASIAEHRYHTGRLDFVDELIRGILNPEPVPVNNGNQDNSQVFTSFQQS